MSGPLLDHLGAERSCDEPNCGRPGAAYLMQAAITPDPQSPRKDTLALVVSVTRTPPFIESEGRRVPNPDHDPSDMVKVSHLEGRWSFCDRDCFENIMDNMWRNIERRRDRLWNKNTPS